MIHSVCFISASNREGECDFITLYHPISVRPDIRLHPIVIYIYIYLFTKLKCFILIAPLLLQVLARFMEQETSKTESFFRCLGLPIEYQQLSGLSLVIKSIVNIFSTNMPGKRKSNEMVADDKQTNLSGWVLQSTY